MLNAEQVGGIVRHLITVIGGTLIAKGVIDESTLVAIAGGAAAFAGAAWSYYIKRKEAKSEKA